MFARSNKSQDKNLQEGLLNYRVDGRDFTVKMTADDSPSRLGPRIAEGDDVMAIWLDWENQNVFKSLSDLLGYEISSTASVDRRHHSQMDKNAILEFCKMIKVHPAHLVPFKPLPEFSLPTPLLELLIDMSRGHGRYSAADIELAEAAINVESRRINSFLYEKSRLERSQNTGDSNIPTLTQTFAGVLDNPLLMRKLARESSDINMIFTKLAYVQYPFSLRVRNVALSGLEDQYAALRNIPKNKEKIVNKALRSVESEYSEVFNSNTSLDQILFFIADVKDALLSRNIEPTEATTNDIVEVLSDWNFEESGLRESYEQYYKYFGFSVGIDLKDSIKGFLVDLAEEVFVYFASEKELSESIRESAQEIDGLPLQDNVKSIFEDDSFKEGTLFRRLMDNRVVIALATHEIWAQPAATPK